MRDGDREESIKRGLRKRAKKRRMGKKKEVKQVDAIFCRCTLLEIY